MRIGTDFASIPFKKFPMQKKIKKELKVLLNDADTNDDTDEIMSQPVIDLE